MRMQVRRNTPKSRSALGGITPPAPLSAHGSQLKLEVGARFGFGSKQDYKIRGKTRGMRLLVTKREWLTAENQSDHSTSLCWHHTRRMDPQPDHPNRAIRRPYPRGYAILPFGRDSWQLLLGPNLGWLDPRQSWILRVGLWYVCCLDGYLYMRQTHQNYRREIPMLI